MLAPGRKAGGKSAIVGIDIGSSYIKTQVFEVSTCDGRALTFKDHGSPYPNNKPRPSVVSGTKQSLQQWQVSTRSGAHHRKRLNYCRSSSQQQFQFINPKRCFLVKHDEVDAASLARDTGLPPEAAEADHEGYIRMKVTCGGVQSRITMNDVFGAMVYDVLVDIHNLNLYDNVLAVAVTLPNTISLTGRTKAHTIVREQLKMFERSLLKNNQTLPYIFLIPEGVAAAREACTSLQRELLEVPLRVMTVDSGHSTLDVSQMTISNIDGNFIVTDVINTGNAFCGVKDIGHALLAKLPAEELQKAAEDAADSGKLRLVNDVLDYVDECVVAASESGPPSDCVSAGSQNYELAEAAPVTRAEVAEASQVLSGPGEQVIRRNLLLSQLCGQQAPAYAFTTGGGGMVPSLVSAVRRILPSGTQILPSQGGNRQSVARGGALLVFDGLQRHFKAQHQAHSAAEAAGGNHSTAVEPAYLDSLLPDYWTGPLGCHIAVWSTFTPSVVASIRSIDQLRDLKQRITPAAMLPGTGPGNNPQPDLRQRQVHLRQMLDYVDYRIAALRHQQSVPKELRILQEQQGQRGPRAPAVDRDIPFYYSLILPQTMLPCGPVRLPWKLYRPEGCDVLQLQLLRLDPIGAETEIFAGDYSVPAPDDDQCVQMSVAVDAEGKILCEALLQQHAAKDGNHGQPLPVTTNHDRYAAQRQDRHRRVQLLPPHVQQFLRQLNGEEAAAVALVHSAVTSTAAAMRTAARAGQSAEQQEHKPYLESPQWGPFVKPQPVSGAGKLEHRTTVQHAGCSKAGCSPADVGRLEAASSAGVAATCLVSVSSHRQTLVAPTECKELHGSSKRPRLCSPPAFGISSLALGESHAAAGAPPAPPTAKKQAAATAAAGQPGAAATTHNTAAATCSMYPALTAWCPKSLAVTQSTAAAQPATRSDVSSKEGKGSNKRKNFLAVRSTVPRAWATGLMF